MENKTTFFLPTRKGSLRVKDKNTRPFANFKGGLLENKIIQLLECEHLDEIILSTNDEECIRIATAYIEKDDRLKIDIRPDHLCLDTTNLSDLIAYVPSITDANHIVWGHVTTPLAGGKDYDGAITAYKEGLNSGFDSLIGVTEFKNFLLNKDGKLINNSTDIAWPRTQDLEVLYEINHVVFIASRDIYQSSGNRVGKHPFLHKMDKIASVDVDWEEDFKIAEILHGSIKSI